MSLLDAALAWYDAGCHVLPLKADGSKGPAVASWTIAAQATERIQSREDAAALFSGVIVTDGIGLVCGAASTHVELLECEGRAVDQVDRLGQDMVDAGLGGLWTILQAGYVESTPSGGKHWLLRTEGPSRRNLKLARRPTGDGAGVEVMWETRGQGGFVVVAPSSGRSHPTGSAWTTITGSPASIPEITCDERDALYAVVSQLDQMPTVEVGYGTRSFPAVTGDELRPGDDYNARADWADILHGWTATRRLGRGIGWRRPGKDTPGISATTGMAADADRLFVFSGSAGLPTETPLSKFWVYAELEHRGDLSAAASALRKAGYGAPLPPRDEWAGILPPGHAASPAALVGQPLAARAESGIAVTERERTSWWLHSLEAALTSVDDEPKPVILARSDGPCLFYAGRINGIIGESESGKTWLALLAVTQALADPDTVVLYLDFEDSARGIVGRLRAMQVADEQIRRLLYVRPDERLSEPAQADLRELLARGPALIVLDGFNAAMTLLGLDLLSNTDATRFAQQVLNPLAATGAAVLYVDHVPKAADQRGKGGIGAQAKRAMTTGCAVSVEVEDPFGRGMTGQLKVWVDKDRPGHVREVAVGGRYVGKATLSSDPGSGLVSVQIDPGDMRPAEAKRDDRVTTAMVSISHLLRGAPEGLTTRKIQDQVQLMPGVRDNALWRAQETNSNGPLGRLRVAGYVDCSPRPGGGLIWVHRAPFYAETELVARDD